MSRVQTLTWLSKLDGSFSWKFKILIKIVITCSMQTSVQKLHIIFLVILWKNIHLSFLEDAKSFVNVEMPVIPSWSAYSHISSYSLLLLLFGKISKPLVTGSSQTGLKADTVTIAVRFRRTRTLISMGCAHKLD
jgi:hypothetical protein